MKVKIEYGYDTKYSNMFPCWARDTNSMVTCCGESFQEAKQRLLEKLKFLRQIEATAIPPPEEVEI